MNKLVLESVGVKGEIEASDSILSSILSDPFTFHYLPNGKISKGNGKVKVFNASELERLAKIEYPIARLSNYADSRSYVVLCEYLMERERQERLEIYSISSSSVYKENSGVIFFGGDTNLGKSSCALELSEKGYTFFSDEKTLLNLEKKLMIGGSRSVPLRKEIIKKKFASNNGDFEKMNYNSLKTPEIKLIILPHLDHGLRDSIITPFAPLDLFWHLTKEFSRRIRGNTKFVNYFEYLLPSLDTDELAQKRVASTKEFSNQVEGYYFQGDLNQLIKFVDSKI